jgi:hypothetical protein
VIRKALWHASARYGPQGASEEPYNATLRVKLSLRLDQAGKAEAPALSESGNGTPAAGFAGLIRAVSIGFSS